VSNIGSFQLTRERFEDAGIVVNEVPTASASTEVGANTRGKTYFETSIANSWRSNVTSIVETGALLLAAEEELDRDIFRALKIPFSLRQSQMLRRIARHPVLRDKTYHGSFPACWRTLYALAELDDCGDLIRAALAAGTIHTRLARKDARAALGLSPTPPRGGSKGNGAGEVPLDPGEVWAAFPVAVKTAILDNEGRVGLATLMSQELLGDLVGHAIRQEMLSATVKLKPAVTLTLILRAALDPAGGDSGTTFERFKAKLKGLGFGLHDVSIALKAKKGKQ
jgi:hypothetical protein